MYKITLQCIHTNLAVIRLSWYLRTHTEARKSIFKSGNIFRTPFICHFDLRSCRYYIDTIMVTINFCHIPCLQGEPRVLQYLLQTCQANGSGSKTLPVNLWNLWRGNLVLQRVQGLCHLVSSQVAINCTNMKERVKWVGIKQVLR